MRKHFQLATILALRPVAHDNLEPGSPAWHEHRSKYRNASDAPAVLGADDYRTRNDVLLARHRGFQPDVDSFKQGILDSGHSIEALMRPIAEAIVGEDLYPRVFTRGIVGASLDGCVFSGKANWECKRLNEVLRAALPYSGPNTIELNDARELPLKHRIQMEQQLLVRGAERCLFSAGHEEAGAITDARHCWYESDPKLRQDILEAWNQLEEDEETYVPPEVVDVTPIIARSPDQLPAPFTRVSGALVLESNLKEWEDAALAYIKGVREHELKTDEDFANADAAAKWCDTSKSTLVGVKASLLSATGDVNTALGTLDRIVAELDATRLAFTKAIAARKETRKTEIVKGGEAKLVAKIEALNARLAKLMQPGAKPLMPAITHEKIAANFGQCILNKRNFKLMQDAVDQHLARTIIAATNLADLFEANLGLLATEAKDHKLLFADWRDLMWKDTEDLQAKVRQRIADHLAEEKRKADVKAEADRQAEAKRQAEAAAPAPTPEPQRVPVVDSLPPGPTGVIGGSVAGGYYGGGGGRRLESVTDVQPRAASNDAGKAPAPRAAPTTPPSLKVGDMNTRLGFIVTSALIVQLGFQPAVREGTKILWHEQDFPLICDALMQHIASVRNTTNATEEAA